MSIFPEKKGYKFLTGFMTEKGAKGAATVYRKYGMVVSVAPYKNYEGKKLFGIHVKEGTETKLMSSKSMKSRIHNEAHNAAYKAVHGHYYDSYYDNPYYRV